MVFWRMLGADFRRLFLSWRLYAAVAGVAVIGLVCLLPEAEAITEASVYYLVDARGGLGAFLLTMTVMAVLPFGLCHREDLRDNYVHGLEVRAGRAAACWSHVTVTAASAFLAVFLGYFLCVALLSAKQPVLLDSDVENMLAKVWLNPELDPATLFSGYDRLVLDGHIFLYFCAVFATEALGYAFLACLVLTVSLWIEDPFILLSIPVAFYYASDFILNAVSAPGIFCWHYIMESGGWIRAHIPSPLPMMLGVVLYFAALIGIEGLIYRIGREVRHG